ncbi:TPA: hypothetical protein ACTW6G_004630 [Raoultella ornithinolytica]
MNKESIAEMKQRFQGVLHYCLFLMFFFNRRAKKQGQLEKRSFDKLALAYNPMA